MGFIEWSLTCALPILTPEIASGINSGASARAVRQASDEDRLTPAERATIIDAQATHLLGTTLRLRGDAQAAKAAQIKGLADALAVREGRVTSIVRLRSPMLGELALAEDTLRAKLGRASVRERVWRLV